MGEGHLVSACLDGYYRDLALRLTMSRIAATLAVVGALLFSAGPAWPKNIGPSFDCDKASTKVEHAICASDDLSALDRILADAYKVAKGLDNSTTLRDEQRQWNKERSVKCPGKKKDQCLRTVYLRRVADLVEYFPQQIAKISCSILEHYPAKAMADVQEALQVLDLYSGKLDGIIGPKTRSAIQRWQKRNGYPENGEITEIQIIKLEQEANEEAYLFGWLIQKTLQQKDLVKFYKLVSDDEPYGPPESFALSKTFDEVFPQDWVDSILDSEIPCMPGPGSELFNMGPIWFGWYGDSWKINRIFKVPAPEVSGPKGWVIDGIIVHPNCLIDYSFKDGWEIGSTTLSQSLTSKEVWNCGSNIPVEIIDSGWQGWKIKAIEAESDPVRQPYREYHVTRTLPFSLCDHFGSDCLELKIINLHGNGGGTLYFSHATVLYGLFRENEGDLTVTALKIFAGLNDALKYLDSLTKK